MENERIERHIMKQVGGIKKPSFALNFVYHNFNIDF